MPGKILIVDDIATNRISLRVKLSAAYYDVLQAKTGTEALGMVAQHQPDLILTSTRLPDMEGMALCRAVHRSVGVGSIPVVIITPIQNRDMRIAALLAGADDVLSKPLDDQVLLARLRALLRARDAAEELRLRDNTNRALGFAEDRAVFDLPAQVALVTAKPTDAVLWRTELRKYMRDDLQPVAMADALRKLGTDPAPEVFLVALDDAKVEAGFRLLADIRARPETRHAAILALLPAGSHKVAANALDLGANDLVTEGFDAQEIALRIAAQLRRKRLADKLRKNMRDGLRASIIDPLTGLYNRRYAMPHLARIAQHAADTGRRYTIMVADLDHFKSVNDTWGHAAGDAVLTTVARIFQENLRAVDLVARIGGEEFLIAMPETDKSAAQVAAKRLCRIIQSTPIRVENTEKPLHVTVSIGAAVGADPKDIGQTQPAGTALLEQADKALYGAKSRGRNQVTFSERSAA